jgi:hypothetical protein
MMHLPSSRCHRARISRRAPQPGASTMSYPQEALPCRTDGQDENVACRLTKAAGPPSSLSTSIRASVCFHAVSSAAEGDRPRETAEVSESANIEVAWKTNLR